MTKLTSLIQELEELEKKATPKWEAIVSGVKQDLFFNNVRYPIGPYSKDVRQAEIDAKLMATSRNALPKLLQCLKVLSEAIEYTASVMDGEYNCYECGGPQHARQALKTCEEILNAV